MTAQRVIISHTAPDPKISEAAWTSVTISLAQVLGWHANHQRPGRTKQGWSTAIEGNDGFPDICASHPEYGVVFLELKSWRGKLQPNQEQWRDKILAGGGRWYLLRPADWNVLVEILTGGG
jgi:hypothetical protein